MAKGQRDGRWYEAGRPIRNTGPYAYRGVYFLQWGAFVKVGCAGNVLTRCRGLRFSVPFGETTLLGWIPLGNVTANQFAHERDVHCHLEACRVRGEWFKDCPEIRRFIAEHARPVPEA